MCCLNYYSGQEREKAKHSALHLLTLILKGAYGKLRLDGEVAVNLIVVKKGERFDEAGKIRI